MKKFLFFIALFFTLCVLFHKQILGAAAKFAFKMQCDCNLAYRFLSWEKGELVFSDLILFDPSFHVHIERASLRFDWSAFPKKLKGHFTLDRPRVSAIKNKQWPKKRGSSWSSFTVSIREGLADWGGAVRFSLDYADLLSRLTLDWEDASAILTLQEGEWEAELNHFKAELLQTWFPFAEIFSGRLTGRIVLNEKQEPISANLKVVEIGADLKTGSVEQMEGSLSYNATLGAKWELQGVGVAQGKQFPFLWRGRGFFKSHWIESELEFQEGGCKISREEMWTLECRRLRSEQATLLQAGAAIVCPELASWSLSGGIFDGRTTFSPAFWNAQFEGEHFSLRKGDFSLECERMCGDLTQDGGSLILTGQDYDLKAAGTWDCWNAEARLSSLQFAMRGGWDGSKFPVQIERGVLGDFHFAGRGWFDLDLDGSFSLEGQWAVAQREIPFYCPQFSKRGKEWAFDFRFMRQTWDLLRIAGTSDGKEIFYSKKSHFLGAPLHFAAAPLGALDIYLDLPWKAVLSAGPLLKEWGVDLAKMPALGETALCLQYKEGKTVLLAQGASPPFALRAERSQDAWTVDLQSDLAVHAVLHRDGFAKGRGQWKTGLEVEFEGRIHPSLRCEFSLPKVRFDLAQIGDPNVEGKFEGQGHFLYDGQIESDFDFATSSLKIYSHAMENEGLIHLYYSSARGALFRGLNLHGPFDCVVDLLEYDAAFSRWILHDAQVHLPASFLTHRLLQFLDRKDDLHFTANLNLASDFSTFVCTMREGLIPFGGASRHIENLHLFWERNECKAALHYLDHLYRIHLHVDERIAGRLILGEEEIPLAIDWEYGDALTVRAIEGSFGGVEASFHAESADTLIGSARLDFSALSEFLPADVAEVFEEIKMGKGYELKGRLKIEKNLPFFRGILCGKQIELFGFQFRTLLGQVDLGPECMRIFDVKISDTAGMMKIEDMILKGKGQQPWIIDIPSLSIHELRPSLLQRPGGPVGPISPLVVRELKISGFKGILEDGKTYTAKGNLHFINSYKREETVFDLPANVLSRIVGLDLELLIPVTGDLEFELKDGFFNLTSLTNAYSEAKRSEFFLETDPPPSMDLDGNLNIFIKMKQFVLLKFTESFLISIEGQLDDPRFHLQKKRFFGLM